MWTGDGDRPGGNIDLPFDLHRLLVGLGLETSHSQLDLFDRFKVAWSDHAVGVLPGGRNLVLRDCCSEADECWKSLGPDRIEPSGTRGGISLPWIGARYAEHRVVLMGLNLVRSGGLIDEINITADTVTKFAEGSRQVYPRGHQFQYKSTLMVNAVLERLDGHEVPSEPPPTPPAELIAALTRSARIQAVRCSPWGDGPSEPSLAMGRNCPKKLTGLDVEILAPRVLIAAHSTAIDRLWKLTGRPDRRSQRGLDVWMAAVGGRTFTVLGVDHPSSRAPGGWSESWRRLAEHLNGDDPFLV